MLLRVNPSVQDSLFPGWGKAGMGAVLQRLKPLVHLWFFDLPIKNYVICLVILRQLS